ncbi:hypothetical protein ACOSP7_008373 [Xanthoceras sorbifolium]
MVFNEILALLVVISCWPLIVYFPLRYTELGVLACWFGRGDQLHSRLDQGSPYLQALQVLKNRLPPLLAANRQQPIFIQIFNECLVVRNLINYFFKD